MLRKDSTLRLILAAQPFTAAVDFGWRSGPKQGSP